MKRRLLKVAITTALSVALAVPAFANPFTDVPSKHWAYDAVTQLAQAGVIDGYGDGTFRGDRTMTRYEMAQIVAKAMNKDLTKDQKAVVDKLAQEYASELNSLGIKVADLQNQMDNMVKFSGDARVRYYSADNDDNTKGDRTEYRVRLGATANINHDTSIYARLSSGSAALWEGIPAASAPDTNSTSGGVSPTVENVYVKTKIFGADTKIGRQDYSLGYGLLAGQDAIALVNGISMSGDNLMAFAGKELDSNNSYGDSYGGQLTFELGVPITIDALRLGDKDYYSIGTNFELFPNFHVYGEYGRNDTDDATAYQVKAGIGNTGLSIAYNDIDKNALPYESALNLKAKGPSQMSDFYTLSTVRNVKGTEYAYNKDITKNVNVDLVYQDITDHGQNVRATASVKF